MMTDKVRYVIFSGANERAIIASCRYFCEAGFSFSLIARPLNDKIRLTRYRKNIDAIRQNDAIIASDMLSCIALVSRKYPQDKLVFLPSSESINRIILSCRQHFEQAGLDCYLCPQDCYETLSNKKSFIALTAEFDIDSPVEIKMPGYNDLPLVAKPSLEFSSSDGRKIYPVLIIDNKDLDDFFINHQAEEYFYQEYVVGESYYYLMFLYSNGNQLIRYQRNLLQQDNGKSIIAAEACDCPDLNFERKLISAFRAVDFSGFVMVEVIKNNDKTFLIEANPRLWGPLQLAIQQGITPNLIHDYPDVPNNNTSVSPYLWINGLISDVLQGKKPHSYFRKDECSICFIIMALCHDIYLHSDTLLLFIYEIKISFSHYLKKLVTKFISRTKNE